MVSMASCLENEGYKAKSIEEVIPQSVSVISHRFTKANALVLKGYDKSMSIW